MTAHDCKCRILLNSVKGLIVTVGAGWQVIKRTKTVTSPWTSSFLKTLKSLVAMKPNSLSQASESVAIISAMEVSPPTLDSRL